jgi:A/G-specific adenine glycosylase
VTADGSPIAQRLIDWHAAHGRHHLPWQQDRSPYRVWVSEIMLQQTQVAAVIPYYERFMRRFPDVRALADAPVDEVLHLWSGLGYYARARNLHRAAAHIRDVCGGGFPKDFDAVAALPGIGRSTAGAILALSGDQRFAILDGNVRRVLARYFGEDGPRGRVLEARLWEWSQRCTPHARVADYTQAIMDLGATLCVRRRPLCSQCPLREGCFAERTGRQHDLPAARRAPARDARHVFMLVALEPAGAVLLERRPQRGVWGGLWCLPEFASASAAHAYVRNALDEASAPPQPLGPIEHAFTHFDLTITPLLVRCATQSAVREEGALWYNVHAPARVGLPAPVTGLLSQLAGASRFGSVA